MKKRYILPVATALIWLGVGCNKYEDFGNVNENPGATTQPVLSALLTNVEAGVGGYASTNNVALNGAQYAQYVSETQYSGTSLYTLPQIGFTGYYSGDLYDLQNIINLNQSKNTSAVAKILQQYIFWTITDAWGDVPYSEALKGIESITPKYDKQEDIYKGMMAKLTEAVGEFDNSSSLGGDIIFGGDVASWKRTANSLKALMALQLSEAVPAASGYAATAFKEAIAAGVITSNDQNFEVAYPGGNFSNPWWSIYNGRKDYGESETLTDITGDLNDPRQTAFGGASELNNNTQTSNIGVPYGLARNNVIPFTDANPNWARVLKGNYRAQSSPLVIISAGMMFLARAEAANLGWTSENAATMYQNGITASFDQWDAGTPSSSYLSQSSVALTGNAAAQYNKIVLQRYIASYPNGHQGWDIWRKTGVPALTPAPDATNDGGEIVRRFVYATSEYSSNEANVKEAVARLQGGDDQDSHVWWDK